MWRRRLGLGLCLVAAAWIAFAACSAARFVGSLGPGFPMRANLTVGPGAPPRWPAVSSDLRFHDLVVAMDGAPVDSVAAVRARLARAGEGTPIEYTFRRRGHEFRRTFPVIAITAGDLAGYFGVFLFVSLGFVVVALLVLRGGGEDAATLPLCGVAAALAFWFASSIEGVSLGLDPVTGRLSAYALFLGYDQLPSTLFALYATFPSRRGFARRRPWLVPSVVALFAGCTAAHALAMALSTAAWIRIDEAVSLALIASAVLAASGVLWDALRAPDPVDRLRARIVAAGFLPSCVLGPLGFLLPVLGIAQVPSHWLALLALGLPIGLAAAILRVGLFGLDRRVRHGLVVSLVVSLFVGGYVAGGALAILAHAGADLGRFDLLVALGTLALAGAAREGLDRLLGRTLFRAPLDLAETVARVDGELAAALDGERIARILAAAIDRALAPEWVRVRLPGEAASEPPPIDTALSAPLIGAASTRPGALLVGPRRAGRRWERDAALLVAALAAQARAALANAHAVGELRKLSAALEARVADRTARLADARAELAHAEKLASLGELVATVAHEINNPLHFVQANQALVREALGEIEAAARESWEALVEHAPALGLPLAAADGTADFDGEAFARAYGILDEIALGARRMRAIVEALRSFARREASELGPVDLRAAIDAAADAVRARLPAGTLVVEGSAPPVRASAPELERLFANLLGNAVDATAGRGEVRVTVRADGAEAEATVEDSGPGIPDGALPRLFDPFFTTKEVGRGAGLGLSVCYGIVRRCGGTIDAANRASGGARFRVRLPLATPT